MSVLLDYWTLVFATVSCTIIAVGASIDSFLAFRQDRKKHIAAVPLGNGRALVARGRYDIAKWFLVAFLSVVGMMAIGIADLFTETTYSGPIRILFTFTLFCFWKAKRRNRRMTREAAAMAAEEDARTRSGIGPAMEAARTERDAKQDARAATLDRRAQSLSERGKRQDERGRMQDEREDA